jgi:two-component system, NarL family, invasion response regulator UvrY
MTEILLADDHAVIREGLKTYIRKMLPHSKIDEAYDGDSAFKKIEHNDYALIILDINMPATDFFGLVSNILAVKPESKILIFSMNPEEIFAKKYLQLGVLGYLNKKASIGEIKQAITDVINNKRYLSPLLTEMLARIALGKEPNNQNPFDLLSGRELEIVMCLMKGESVSKIGAHLNLHTSTVGTHKARIFKKLNCKNVIELNELAIIHNLIQPG